MENLLSSIRLLAALIVLTAVLGAAGEAVALIGQQERDGDAPSGCRPADGYLCMTPRVWKMNKACGTSDNCVTCYRAPDHDCYLGDGPLKAGWYDVDGGDGGDH